MGYGTSKGGAQINPRCELGVEAAEGLHGNVVGDVVSVTRRSSGVAPRACVRVYARVLVPPNLCMHTYRV